MRPAGDAAVRYLPLGAGPLAAVLLGLALVPFRGTVSASNLSFAFMALTIVTAELGGRAAALATALTAALSLDYFLTAPYFRLSIEAHEDLVAFVGLATCGLVAAGLGSSRSERIAALSAIRRHRDLLRALLRDGDRAAGGGAPLSAVLRACVDALPLAGAALRDGAGRLVACAAPADERRAAPAAVLEPPARAPAEGGRIALAAGASALGSLDVWGDGGAADAESRQALWDVARLLALLLAARAGEPGADGPDGR
jgi:uncharacterized protein DUF4118